MYPIYFAYFITSLIINSLTKLRKTENWAKSYLTDLAIKLDGKFEDTIVKKVSRYQSIQLHFVANSFSKLHGRLNNEKEVERNLLFFLMSVLYDEIIDNQKMNERELDNLFYHPELANPSNFNEKVLIYIHQKLIDQVNDKEHYWKTLQNTHQAQIDSKKQFDPLIATDEILDITKRKGGYTLLMCRHYLIDPQNDLIDNCWYSLGGLIQMTNDLYDTYKDTQDGINTFANQIKRTKLLSDAYETQLNTFNLTIKNLPISKMKKIEFGINMSIISSFGFIAIRQLKQLEKQSNFLPNFKEVDRKDLIIDMEKISNRCRLLHYSYKIGKSWM
jgi:hypothetical protein